MVSRKELMLLSQFLGTLLSNCIFYILLKNIGDINFNLYSQKIYVYSLQMHVKDQVFVTLFHSFNSDKKRTSLRWTSRATTNHIAVEGMKIRLLNLLSHDEIKVPSLI